MGTRNIMRVFSVFAKNPNLNKVTMAKFGYDLLDQCDSEFSPPKYNRRYITVPNTFSLFSIPYFPKANPLFIFPKHPKNFTSDFHQVPNKWNLKNSRLLSQATIRKR